MPFGTLYCGEGKKEKINNFRLTRKLEKYKLGSAQGKEQTQSWEREY